MEEQQSQVEDTQVVEPSGEETPQAAEQTEETLPGAEEPQVEPEEPEKAEKPERTYSQAEVSKMESAKDTEIAELRKQHSEAEMQRLINEAIVREEAAQKEDKRQVDEGLMTSTDAEQKKADRMSRAQVKIQEGQLKSQMAVVGRYQAAQDYANEWGVDPSVLLRDESLTNPKLMEDKAKELWKQGETDKRESLEVELKKLRNPEQVFDQGLSGTGGSSNPDKVIERYSDGKATREEYEKAMQAKGLTP